MKLFFIEFLFIEYIEIYKISNRSRCYDNDRNKYTQHQCVRVHRPNKKKTREEAWFMYHSEIKFIKFRVLKIFYFLISNIAFNSLWNKRLEYDRIINNSVVIE